MDALLSDVRERVRNYAGLTRKRPLKDIYKRLVLEGPAGPQLTNYGDDAAAISFKDGYLLMATDGIMTGLLVNEPYAAGKASVMVTVNDIYSMGGHPLALVNVLASGDDEQRALIVDGIRKGCDKLRVPMVGGHLHPDAPLETPHLAVAILGWAEKVLHGYNARPGDRLIFAADLSGQAGCKSVVSWDANSGKTTEEILYRLEALPMIAGQELASACKDVSNAGLLGTVSIMMENSGTGARIDMNGIPLPAAIALADWLTCFQSFGFILSVPEKNAGRVVEIFKNRKVEAAVIGEVTEERRVVITRGDEEATLFDFSSDVLTGIVKPAIGE